jgi:hypothetical protein
MDIQQNSTATKVPLVLWFATSSAEYQQVREWSVALSIMMFASWKLWVPAPCACEVEIHLMAMTIEEILSHIDAEIGRLTEARDLVAGAAVGKVSRSARKSGLAAPKPRAVRRKRVISPEGRARIAAAQKLRWAKQKRAKEKR